MVLVSVDACLVFINCLTEVPPHFLFTKLLNSSLAVGVRPIKVYTIIDIKEYNSYRFHSLSEGSHI